MNFYDTVKVKQAESLKRINKNVLNAKPRGIVFFGDSIIENFNIEKYFPQKQCYNCGCDKATSDTLLHLQPYIAEYKADKVIVMIGTYDLDNEWQFDKLEIAFNIYKLIQIMRNQNPAVDVIVISPLPIIEEKQGGICKNNTQLKLLGKEMEANVKEFAGTVYIDVFPNFLDEKKQLKQELTIDGLLLNDAGYALLASLIHDYI